MISFGSTFEETFEGLQLIFKRFQGARLKLKVSKSKFFQESVEFLGHIVSDEGISCDPKKLEAVENWPKPSCVKEVHFWDFVVTTGLLSRGFQIWHPHCMN